jgi:hypothetical protein
VLADMGSGGRGGSVGRMTRRRGGSWGDEREPLRSCNSDASGREGCEGGDEAVA